MARNFGFRGRTRRNGKSRAWPMFVIAFATVGLITAAAILHHG
jgi:hypothetical protein